MTDSPDDLDRLLSEYLERKAQEYEDYIDFYMFGGGRWPFDLRDHFRHDTRHDTPLCWASHRDETEDISPKATPAIRLVIAG